MRKLLTLALLALAGIALLALAGCPANPDADKKVQEAVKVPGLQESVLAIDRAIQAAIEGSWNSDPELQQEQLAVEEVHAGRVRITGIVSRPELKDRAEEIARNTEHVKDVVSTITVDASKQENRVNLDDM